MSIDKTFPSGPVKIWIGWISLELDYLDMKIKFYVEMVIDVTLAFIWK